MDAQAAFSVWGRLLSFSGSLPQIRGIWVGKLLFFSVKLSFYYDRGSPAENLGGWKETLQPLQPLERTSLPLTLVKPDTQRFIPPPKTSPFPLRKWNGPGRGNLGGGIKLLGKGGSPECVLESGPQVLRPHHELQFPALIHQGPRCGCLAYELLKEELRWPCWGAQSPAARDDHGDQHP